MRNPIECENAFKAWLEVHFGGRRRVVSDAVSRCRRINDELGDLAAAYRNDRCANMLRLLTYSTEDARNGVPPPEEISFNVQPDAPRYYERIKEGLDALRSALQLYLRFRSESTEMGPSRVLGPKNGSKGGRSCAIKACKVVQSGDADFNGYVGRFHDWLINEDILRKNSADQYETYIKKLAQAIDEAFGTGWFEALPSEYESNQTSEKLLQCSAFMEGMIRNASREEKKAWRNWRSAFQRFEDFLYDITDTYRVDQENDVRTTVNCFQTIEVPQVERMDDNDESVIVTRSHSRLLNIFTGRLKTQGRYYPAHQLLFPTRLLTKIFRGQRQNAWTAWLKAGIENMRVWITDTDSVPFSDVRELKIRGNGNVEILCANRERHEVWTKTANGPMRRECALRGVRDLSIDHVIPLENVIGARRNHLQGLIFLTEKFREFNNQHGGGLDARSEYYWINDFWNQYGNELATPEIRALIMSDLQILEFQYEVMDARENSIKSNR